jgi:hypothetical protein
MFLVSLDAQPLYLNGKLSMQLISEGISSATMNRLQEGYLHEKGTTDVVGGCDSRRWRYAN